MYDLPTRWATRKEQQEPARVGIQLWRLPSFTQDDADTLLAQPAGFRTPEPS